MPFVPTHSLNVNPASWPDGGNCVEVAERPGGRRGVHDSKNPTSPVLLFSRDEWNAIINGAKTGEFD